MFMYCAIPRRAPISAAISSSEGGGVGSSPEPGERWRVAGCEARRVVGRAARGEGEVVGRAAGCAGLDIAAKESSIVASTAAHRSSSELSSTSKELIAPGTTKS